MNTVSWVRDIGRASLREGLSEAGSLAGREIKNGKQWTNTSYVNVCRKHWHVGIESGDKNLGKEAGREIRNGKQWTNTSYVNVWNTDM